MEFKELVKKRYAVKKFNGEKLPKENVDELLEMIRMAPSSFGLQPWKVKIVSDSETKEKLLSLSYNQEQITTCSHILIFCANSNISEQIDKYEKMLKRAGMADEKISGYIGMMRGFEKNMDDAKKISWAEKQTFIAIGNAVNGATSLGFDSCPMEGFDTKGYKLFLELPENLHPCAIVTIGIAADEAKPKIRFSKEDMFF